jgi:calcium-dependent protein kinase
MGCSGGKAVASPPGAQAEGQSPKSRSSCSSSSSNKRGAGKGNKQDPFDTVLVLDHTRRIQNFYADEDAGARSIGDMRRVRNKNTQEVRSLKTRAKVDMERPELIKQEIEIRGELDHPNIAKLHEAFEDHRNVYLVSELCQGGELFDRIIEAGRITEAQAAAVMQQVLSAVHHMHGRRVCHRDLTIDSFFFAGPGPVEKSVLKLVDFGSATKFEPGQVLSTKVGTSYYVAPQVLARKYDNACDLWSCGVIMYVTLCGYPPFCGEKESETLAQVKSGKFTFKNTDWCGVSEDAKDLVRGLLTLEPRRRLRAEQALDQEWIKNWAPRAPKVPSLLANFVANLRGFRLQNRLKKVALQIIARQLNESEIRGLRDVFQALDRNQDGLLSVAS